MFNVAEMFDSIVDNWRGELVDRLEAGESVALLITMSPEAYTALRNDTFMNTGEIIKREFHDTMITVNVDLIGIKNMYASIVIMPRKESDPYNKFCKNIDI